MLARIVGRLHLQPEPGVALRQDLQGTGSGLKNLDQESGIRNLDQGLGTMIMGLCIGTMIRSQGFGAIFRA